MLKGRAALKALAERAGKMGMDVRIVETSHGIGVEVKGSMTEFLRALRTEVEAQERKKKTESNETV